MKRIFSILFALVLVLGLTVTPVIAAPAQVWHVPGDFATIQQAVDAAQPGDTIMVGPGSHYGALVDKSVTIKGKGGAVIDDGPILAYDWELGFRLMLGSDGATISHFTFDEVTLPVYGNHGVDDVTIEHNKIYDTMQGITNWDGNGWIIKHNVIEGIWEEGSGGIGIAVGSRGSTVSDNIISHNRIVAHIERSTDGFSVGGILLCTDERKVPPRIVSYNKIVHNRVKITGLKSWAIALQLIPPKDTDPIGILRDNIVGFNDLRGSDDCIGYYPDADTLEPINTISRNLGEDANRGHGEVPANVFNPN